MPGFRYSLQKDGATYAMASFDKAKELVDANWKIIFITERTDLISTLDNSATSVKFNRWLDRATSPKEKAMLHRSLVSKILYSTAQKLLKIAEELS